jgi:hypothetical protein
VGKRVCWALVLAGCAVLTVPLASPQTSTATLEETLSWLKGFLPNATGGAQVNPNGTTHAAADLEVLNGCQVRLVITPTFYGLDGRAVSVSTIALLFSLADIEPSSVNARAMKGGEFEVVLGARNNAMIISHSGVTHYLSGNFPDEHGGALHSSTSAWIFGDRGSADRVANAFRHAAELCGKPQPF